MHITMADVLEYINTRTDGQVIGYPLDSIRTLLARVADHRYPSIAWRVLDDGHIIGADTETGKPVTIKMPPDVLLIHQIFENISKGVVLKGDL